MDVAIYSKAANASDIHVQFVDWIPLICTILGMAMYFILPMFALPCPLPLFYFLRRYSACRC